MATEEQKSRFNEVYQTALKSGTPHPEVIAAQWALESGWGKKQSGKNNLFGIKAGNGDPNNQEAGTVIWTTENINGKKVKVQQKFRDYESIDQSIADRAKFTLENPRYRKAGYFDATSPAEAAMALQRGKYATDPKYANILIDVMKSAGIDPYNGTRYDNSAKPQPVAPSIPEQSTQTPSDYGFTPPVNMQNTTPSQTENGTDFAGFNQLNTVLNDFVEPQPPKVDYRQQFQQQLASAFGIEPKASNGIPDYIGDLVRSIYDETA